MDVVSRKEDNPIRLVRRSHNHKLHMPPLSVRYLYAPKDVASPVGSGAHIFTFDGDYHQRLEAGVKKSEDPVRWRRRRKYSIL